MFQADVLTGGSAIGFTLDRALRQIMTVISDTIVSEGSVFELTLALGRDRPSLGARGDPK